jgi:hypothetical protein|tara:strand:+ start:399 stop:617 length:219 start_codon:yes stop_codon:yes gene_type:complete
MVKEYVQVKDQKDLVRDPNSKAILNTNIEALAAYKKRKQTYAKIEKIDHLESKVQKIESKIDEVLTTLKKLI